MNDLTSTQQYHKTSDEGLENPTGLGIDIEQPQKDRLARVAHEAEVTQSRIVRVAIEILLDKIQRRLNGEGPAPVNEEDAPTNGKSDHPELDVSEVDSVVFQIDKAKIRT